MATMITCLISNVMKQSGEERMPQYPNGLNGWNAIPSLFSYFHIFIVSSAGTSQHIQDR